MEIECIILGVSIITAISAIAIVKSIDKERIEIDWTRERIYGWYKKQILVSKSFNTDWGLEHIQKLKDEAQLELKEKVKICKSIK